MYGQLICHLKRPANIDLGCRGSQDDKGIARVHYRRFTTPGPVLLKLLVKRGPNPEPVDACSLGTSACVRPVRLLTLVVVHRHMCGCGLGRATCHASHLRHAL